MASDRRQKVTESIGDREGRAVQQFHLPDGHAVHRQSAGGVRWIAAGEHQRAAVAAVRDGFRAVATAANAHDLPQ